MATRRWTGRVFPWGRGFPAGTVPVLFLVSLPAFGQGSQTQQAANWFSRPSEVPKDVFDLLRYLPALPSGILMLSTAAGFALHTVLVKGFGGLDTGSDCPTVKPPASCVSRPISTKPLNTIERQENEGPTPNSTELVAGLYPTATDPNHAALCCFAIKSFTKTLTKTTGTTV